MRATGNRQQGRRLARGAAVFLPLLFVVACGRVGAPVPPVRLTERTAELAAQQRGADIILSFPTPRLEQNPSSPSYIALVNIYRVVERRDQEPFLEETDYENEAELIGTLDRATIEAQVRAIGRIEFKDALDLRQLTPNSRLRYAVRYVNRRGQQARFSNTVAVEPVLAIAAAPGELRLASEAQGELTIEWTPAPVGANSANATPPVGYNIYRTRGNRRLNRAPPLNTEPLTEPRFTDRSFQYESEYTYTVRALSQGNEGLLESADSEPLTVTPEDDFAPSTPEPVSAASANGVISLFWPSSPEADVVGYFVYRAEAADAEEKDWVKLNAQPSAPVTFRDDRVTLGKRYFYRVTAIDKFENESKPSAVVSETAYP